MHVTPSPSSNGCFKAGTLVAAGLLLMGALALSASAFNDDGCKIECYPSSKMSGKGAGSGSGKNDNCRWILRTDGKPARLCDHIKCKKVCPNGGAQSLGSADQLEAASSPASDMRVEQQLEPDQPMGIMRHLHGSKMAKAPVPGVSGGRLSPSAGASSGGQSFSGARRMAPTLPPAVQYDENDTPPPISRFLDISPEE